MERSHEEFIKSLEVGHCIGQTQELQKNLNWWHQFKILIEREENQEQKEGKKPEVRMRYIKRLVEKYAENLNSNGQEVSSGALWDSFVKDAGGEKDGYFIVKYWQGTIKIAIESITGEPMPMENIGYVDTYRDDL